MTTHVFIVNEKTFKLHLEYMFAGTGAKDTPTMFLTKSDVKALSWQTERLLVGMIADINRIRKGDNIVFYLQANNSPGKFFGTFKAASDPFFDENNENNYLKKDLGKGLSYRVLIKPDIVYSKGVTEHEYLDSLDGKIAPHEMCWSLIYRKLKGNRGCTMITDYEYEDLLSKLSKVNNGQHLKSTHFSYDDSKKEIVSSVSTNKYTGAAAQIDIVSRLLHKADKRNAFETHLQAYLTQNIGRNRQFNDLLIDPKSDYWIGNEVSCGVGMQRIDILLIQKIGKEIHIRLIELKDEEPTESIVTDQIPWYLSWLSYYVVPNYKGMKVFVYPTIIAKEWKNDITSALTSHKLQCNGATIKPIEYYGFTTTKTDITFSKLI